MEPKLAAALSKRDLLLAQLREQFPEADEQTIQDTVEGESDVNLMLEAIVRSSLDDTCMVNAINDRITAMQERRARIGFRATKKRELVQRVMERSGIEKLTPVDMTVSLRASPPHVTITDETIIPEIYWLPQAPKLDKAALKNAIKDGENVPGVLLGNISTTLSVRTK